MALSGKPAISDPRTFDLRAVQSAIQNIRERMRLADAAINLLQSSPLATQTASTLSLLQQQITALQQRVTALEAVLGPSDTTQITVDEAVGAGMPVVATTAGHGRLANPTDPTAVFGLIGLATQAATGGQTVGVQRRGLMTINNAAFEPGRAVYAGADGELVQMPTYGQVALPVGVAVSASAVWITLGAPALRVSGFDEPYDRFMPASVDLMTEALEFMAEFNAMADGLMVKVGSTMEGRRLVEGNQIWIDNPDGVDGNPVITWVQAGAVRVLERAAASDACDAVLGP